MSLEARASASPIDNSEAYLFTIARNVLARHMGRRNRLAPMVDLDLATEIQDDFPLQDQQLLDREGLASARQAIEQMPERTRHIFLMHRFEDMTYTSIALHIGISTSAVEKHIMAALRILIQATERNQ